VKCAALALGKTLADYNLAQESCVNIMLRMLAAPAPAPAPNAAAEPEPEAPPSGLTPEAAALKARLESAAAAAGGDQKRALLQGAAVVRTLRYARSRRTDGPRMPLCGPLRSGAGAPMSLRQRRIRLPPGHFLAHHAPAPLTLTLTLTIT
jgi:hypothetical protein